MRTREDIEAYLSRSGHVFRELAVDMWLVSDQSDAKEHIVVRMADELVLFRLKVMELQTLEPKKREEFFEEVLRLNATDMVHGAYGIADGDLIMTATLRLEYLDYNEFSGTLDDFI